jgi:hypothetical protein
MTEQQQLEQQLDRLRRRVAASHPRSHTAAQARDLITFVTSPGCSLSTAQKLAAVRATLRSYKRGIQITDPTLYGPDTWKRDPQPIGTTGGG